MKRRNKSEQKRKIELEKIEETIETIFSNFECDVENCENIQDLVAEIETVKTNLKKRKHEIMVAKS